MAEAKQLEEQLADQMTKLRYRIAIGLGTIALMITGLCVFLQHRSYWRLEWFGKMAVAIAPGGSLHDLNRLAKSLGCPDLQLYFDTHADLAKRSLLASGALVVTAIEIPDGMSGRDALTILWRRYHRTGAYWSARVDTSSNVVLLVSKPGDAKGFSSAMKDHAQKPSKRG